MATLSDQARVAAESRVLRTLEEALEHVHAICFKTGPPRRVGVELEWLLHRLDDPTSPLDLTRLRHALGAHAPPALAPDSPHDPLPHGGTVTLEPGDRLLLCTDGLTAVLADEAIARLLADLDDPSVACEELVRATLAGGAPDNVSVVVGVARP
jgi:serine/threonine protein phosphatase PrpC